MAKRKYTTKQRALIRERMRLYRLKNREHIREMESKYDAAHIEERRAYSRRYRAENREHVRAMQKKAYYKKAKEYKKLGLNTQGEPKKTKWELKRIARENMARLHAHPDIHKWRAKASKASVKSFKEASPEEQKRRYEKAVALSARNKHIRRKLGSFGKMLSEI